MGGIWIRTAEQFFSKSIPEPNSGCWIWLGSIGSGGYGRVLKKHKLAHRVAYEFATGCPIPDGLDVCHHCDTPSCVNPDHLFVGTAADNMRDMHRKGRWRGSDRRGENHHMVKLTEQDVLAIRKDSGTITDMAQRWGMSRTNIWAIRSGKLWKHV